MEMLRFGVFRLAQIWSVVQPDGRSLGFADRRSAVRTAHDLAAAAAATGGAARIVIQDELGKLTTVSPLALAQAPTVTSRPGDRRDSSNGVLDERGRRLASVRRSMAVRGDTPAI